jgi:hypothetical protein
LREEPGPLFRGPRFSHPLGDLEDKPAEGREADAPEKNDRDHCLRFLILQ